MIRLTLFVSSPGDVGAERSIALRVAKTLSHELRGRVALETYLWQQDALKATDDYQSQIPRVVFPAWYYGMPAILKGYLDRVWLPGVAFEIVGGRPRPLLGHIDRFGVVTTYGASRWINDVVVGDPNRKVFMRGLSRLVSRSSRKLWLAQYGMDSIGPEKRALFLRKVETSIGRFGGGEP
jgi:hypothetical protein